MSQTPAEKQAQYEAARERLSRTVFQAAYFDKMAASYGVVPQSAQEAERLLGMGIRLHAQFQAEQNAKQASTSSLIDAAAASLGVGGPAGVDGAVKVASRQLVADNPEIRQDALTFLEYLNS